MPPVARFVSIALCAASGCLLQARAAGAGDTTLAVGGIHFAPRVSSGPLEVSYAGGTQQVAGSGTTVRNADTASIELGWFATDHVSVKLGLGVPPVLHLEGDGTLSGLGELGTARLDAPVLLLRYHFGEPADRLRPALGLGVSYLHYSRIRLAPAVAQGLFLASPASGNALVGPTTATLDSAFAPVASASLAVRLDAHWFAELSAAYAPIRGKATLTTDAPAGRVVSEQTFRMRSVTTGVLVGYAF